VRLVSRHPALFLNLRQPASSQAGNAHLLFPSHSLGSLKEVHIKCGWNQSTFFSTFALSLSSFPLFVVQLSIFARRPSVSIISPRYQPNKLTLTPSCLYSGSIMTEVMTQQGYGLTAPSSRQDIVSALLNGMETLLGTAIDRLLPSLLYRPTRSSRRLHRVQMA
jgi:hypothetical protein